MTSSSPSSGSLTAVPTDNGHVRDLNWSPAVWLLLVVVCGALFLDGLDLSMIGVALPSIGNSLHLSASSLQWIVSGYVLGYGSFLLLGGRTSDLLSRRQVFLVAVGIFGVASVISAFMSNEYALIGLRFVKGASAGFTVPAGLSIVTTTFAEGPARNRALAVYTLCGASGFSLGLVFGGLLTEIGWRIAFLVPGPVALAFVAIGFRVIPRAASSKARLHHFDIPGALSATISLAALVYGVVEAPARGWISVSTIASLVASAVLMVTFIAIEQRHSHPLLRLGILRSRKLVHANVAAAAMFGAYTSFQFIATLYVQDALGWSPIGMALAFLPAGLIVLVMTTQIATVLARVPTAVVIMFGLLAFVIGYGWFLHAKPGDSYAEFLLPTMVFLGIGFGLCFAAVNVQATSGVADHEQGLASGVLNTSLQIGGAVVLAVVTAILGDGGGIKHDELLPHMHTALSVAIGVSGAAAVFTAVHLARTPAAVKPAVVAPVSGGEAVFAELEPEAEAA
jgi:MFS family permease